LPLTLINFSIWLHSDFRLRLFIGCGGKWQESEWETHREWKTEKNWRGEKVYTDQKRWRVCWETLCEGFVSTPEFHPSFTLSCYKLTFWFSILRCLATHVKHVNCPPSMFGPHYLHPISNQHSITHLHSLFFSSHPPHLICKVLYSNMQPMTICLFSAEYYLSNFSLLCFFAEKTWYIFFLLIYCFSCIFINLIFRWLTKNMSKACFQKKKKIVVVL